MKKLLLITLVFGVLFSWFVFIMNWQNWNKNFDKDWERIDIEKKTLEELSNLRYEIERLGIKIDDTHKVIKRK